MAVIMVVLLGLGTPFAPGPPHHPQRHGDDDRRRSQLEPRFGGVEVKVAPEVEPGQADHPDDQGVRGGRRQAQQDRLPDRAAHRDDEGRHHGLGVARLQTVQRAQQQGRGNEQPGMPRALREEIGERSHGRLKGTW